MVVHLINPSHLSFGVGVITPRWLYVLAAATPRFFGDPVISDETLDPADLSQLRKGDVVGIGIHTSNALRGYEIGTQARQQGATVVFGGIHATLYPKEAIQLGGAHAVVKGDGDVIWATVLADFVNGRPKQIYDGGKVAGNSLIPARWDLLPSERYIWASVQTLRGCPKHCSFCSVWRTDGQKIRYRNSDAILGEIVELRRRGFRFIALADDNFYPVSFSDLSKAERRNDARLTEEFRAIRQNRFKLMAGLAELPRDMVFYTQITMEAAEDVAFLDAMQKANIKGALVGVESVTPEGLKSVHKDFNFAGGELVQRLQAFREHGVHVLGSFIFGLPGDGPGTFKKTTDLAQEAGITFAQFVMLTPFPGTVDFARWEKDMAGDTTRIEGIPLTQHWLIPPGKRPKIYSPHPSMLPETIREGTQSAWDRFYSMRLIWERSRCVRSLRARLAFVLISKLYRQMYANIGIATDSARISRSARWARWLARPCRHLFTASPMPDLATRLQKQNRLPLSNLRIGNCSG